MSRTVVIVSVMLVLAACSGAAPSGSTGTVAPAAASVAPATPVAPTVSPSSTAAAGTYSTRHFSVPIDVAVPSFVDPQPAEESANFVTWLSPDEALAIRFLRPVVVYQPGSATAGPLPTDYIGDLLGQVDHGAKFADRKDTTVSGHSTVVLTATTTKSIDGSLGCPGTGISADECFGLQPEYALRIGDHRGTDAGPLLIWLRSAVHLTADVAAEPERFDQLLAGLRFADRPSGSRPRASGSPSSYLAEDGDPTAAVAASIARRARPRSLQSRRRSRRTAGRAGSCRRRCRRRCRSPSRPARPRSRAARRTASVTRAARGNGARVSRSATSSRPTSRPRPRISPTAGWSAEPLVEERPGAARPSSRSPRRDPRPRRIRRTSRATAAPTGACE